MKIIKFGAIDIGSNAIRLLISNVAEVKDTKPVFMKSEMVRIPIRLGQDSFTANKEISEKNCKRIIMAMKAFQLIMKVYEVENFMTCATSALREASNTDDVISLVKKETGISIEVIDGKKEADIISRTTFFKNSKDNKSYLYVDVGGGSTEFSILHQGKKIASKSFKIGAVRMINQVVDDEVWFEIERWIKKETETIETLALLGSGGNINKIFKMSNVSEGKPLKQTKINKFYLKLKALSYEERIVKYNLNLDRADVILPALRIYRKALEWSGATKIYVPQIGLADGMIKVLYENYKVASNI